MCVCPPFFHIMTTINPSSKYILNKIYELRPDVDRIMLIQNDGRSYRFSAIHPAFALLLTTFDGSLSLSETIKRICADFQINLAKANEIIYPLVHNKKTIKIKYDGIVFSFPPNLIVEKKKNEDIRYFNVSSTNCN